MLYVQFQILKTCGLSVSYKLLLAELNGSHLRKCNFYFEDLFIFETATNTVLRSQGCFLDILNFDMVHNN